MKAYFPSAVGNSCYVFPLSVQLQVVGLGEICCYRRSNVNNSTVVSGSVMTDNKTIHFLKGQAWETYTLSDCLLARTLSHLAYFSSGSLA